MTEKEKMISGKIYDANHDCQLLSERRDCKILLNQLNNTISDDKRFEILHKIIAKCGEYITIKSPFYCDYGYNIEIGENFYMNVGCVILDEAKVCFGDNVFIGPNCNFYTACHPLDVKSRNIGLEYAKPITIGDNVWLGGNVTILPGVTIGNNCVIGAGSVVTKDVPPNTVYAGNPARKIKDLAPN